MTKDTAEFSHFHAVACREYTLRREEGASEPKGWIRGNTKIGPVLEVATYCLHGKYGVEIRIMSTNKDNSHSWIRISHGLNKLVTNLNNKDPRRQRAGYLKSSVQRMCVEIGCEGFCMLIKGQGKTTKTGTCRPFHKNHTYWEKNLDRC